MNLREIALKLQATDRFRLNVSELSAIEFAEALIAELAKQNDPVAWGCPGHPETFVSNNKKQNSGYQSMVFFSEPLYTFQPTAEQIANETAEACAKLCINQEFYVTRQDAAEAIRSGAWKEFKK